MLLSSKQKQVIKLMQIANEKIFKAEMLLVELNRNGNQFDYCTHPDMVSIADGIKIKADHIQKIVYQELK